MSDQGPGGPQPPRDDAVPRPAATGSNQGRLGNPTRLVPRQTPPPVQAEPIDPDPLGFEPDPDPRMAAGEMRDPYLEAAARDPYLEADPQSFGRPRFQVIGFPGCLIVSLIASVLLTILLNIVF
jgi:hypothetical protein